MKTFKSLDDWIEIFKGGKQIDNAGRAHDGDALIETAVATFNPSYHEPPAVIGHPKENAPAYAWVGGVKKVARDGVNVLLAKFKDVVPEFEDMVKRGLFKKRSAGFYPNGRLRHVGFLGAVPPAVKGLASLKFTEQEATTFDFYKSQDPGDFLEQKIQELLDGSPEFSDEGIKAKGHITYSEAFTIVQKRYPEITQQYSNNIRL